MWKQAAKEPGKYQTQGKVIDRVTDPEVTQNTRQIQYTFALLPNSILMTSSTLGKVFRAPGYICKSALKCLLIFGKTA